jgi:hypothetical protein
MERIIFNPFGVDDYSEYIMSPDCIRGYSQLKPFRQCITNLRFAGRNICWMLKSPKDFNLNNRECQKRPLSIGKVRLKSIERIIFNPFGVDDYSEYIMSPDCIRGYSQLKPFRLSVQHQPSIRSAKYLLDVQKVRRTLI